MNKKKLRLEVIKRRDELEKEYKVKADKIILEKIRESNLYKKSKNIFIYVGFGSEINTLDYIKIFIGDGKKICVPRTDLKNKVMCAVNIESIDELKISSYGIMEPSEDKEEMRKDDIDLVILPGVAFDNNGGRIGYGGGYYDRFLKDIIDTPKVALAYQIQIVDKIELEKHDIKYDFLITEKAE